MRELCRRMFECTSVSELWLSAGMCVAFAGTYGIMHCVCMRDVADVHSGNVSWSYWHVSWTFCCLGICFCKVFVLVNNCWHFRKQARVTYGGEGERINIHNTLSKMSVKAVLVL